MGIEAAIIGAAVLGAGATTIASKNSANAATQAAGVQSDAARYTADIQRQIYNQTRTDLSPFLQLGQGAISNMQSLIPGLRRTGGGGTTTPAGGGGAGPAATANVNNLTSIGGGNFTPMLDENGQVILGPNGEPMEIAPPQTGGGPASGQMTFGPDGRPLRLSGTGGSDAMTVPRDAGGNALGPNGASLRDDGQSPFLTNLEGFLPGSGNDPSLVALRGLTPGSADPNRLMTAVNSFIPGASDNPNPLLSSVYNLIPGASDTPDAALTALRSFNPNDPNANTAIKNLNMLLYGNAGGSGAGPIDPGAIQAALEATPGYQFTRDQGLKATQNSFAARGLGSSGAAVRGAADYVTGLSNQTYEQRVQDYLNSYNSQYTNTQNAYTAQTTNSLNALNTQFANAQNAYGQAYNNAFNTYGQGFTNAYNSYGQQLSAGQNLLNLGANAGAQVGTQGVQTGANIGNALIGGANATASGIVGSANATSNAITGIANNVGNSAIALALNSGNALNPASTAAPNYSLGGTQNYGIFGGR